MLNSKNTATILIALFAFSLGAGINNIAKSDSIPSSGIKIGVVDVKAVVEKSSAVTKLKKSQNAKKAELNKWITDAKNQVNAQKNKEERAKLIKKLDAELVKKQQTIASDYTKKLTEIDKSISTTIAQSAKAQGYNIVLSKAAVLYGGDDITSIVSKAVK